MGYCLTAQYQRAPEPHRVRQHGPNPAKVHPHQRSVFSPHCYRVIIAIHIQVVTELWSDPTKSLGTEVLEDSTLELSAKDPYYSRGGGAGLPSRPLGR